jgi:hypothetical protein
MSITSPSAVKKMRQFMMTAPQSIGWKNGDKVTRKNYP